MSIINDILMSVIGLAQSTSPYASITIGSLPANNGLSMTYAAGDVDTTFMNKGKCYDLDIVLNGKHSSQQVVSDALNDIHLSLTQRTTYPRTETYQITDIYTSSLPSYLDVEDNGQWLYGSSIGVKVFIF